MVTTLIENLPTGTLSKKNRPLESVKSVSEIYSPVSGKVVKVNSKLDDSPETINESPYDDGWLVEIEMKDPSELDDLLDSDAYKKLIK